MRVALLGTGSADGWPNAFCGCHSCEAERRSGRSRQPSAALVDDVVLVDCGPTAPHAIGRVGGTLQAVEHVLLTHGHPDHLDPAFLLSRGWVAAAGPLQVWGPPGALALCRDWVGPDTQVRFHEVRPGDDLVLATAIGAYAVHVVAAAHESGNGDALAAEAVLFEVTAPDGARLLYATDTGPDVDLSSVTTALDVVLIDETFGDTVDHGTGHLDLATLPPLLAALRARGVVTDATVVVATHLSHHNPPTSVLRERLADHAVLVLDDLAVLDTRFPRGRRPGRHLVLGGARSGKSLFAERLADEAACVRYVATGGSRPDDAEWQHRVEAHRARRPDHWTTIESTDLPAALADAPAASVVLVDCLALWLTAHLDELDAWAIAERGGRATVHAQVDTLAGELVEALHASAADVVLVSNEVGMGVVPATSSGRLFRDLLGIVNARVASACDEATLLVAGLPVPLRSTSHAQPMRRI